MKTLTHTLSFVSNKNIHSHILDKHNVSCVIILDADYKNNSLDKIIDKMYNNKRDTILQISTFSYDVLSKIYDRIMTKYYYHEKCQWLIYHMDYEYYLINRKNSIMSYCPIEYSLVNIIIEELILYNRYQDIHDIIIDGIIDNDDKLIDIVLKYYVNIDNGFINRTHEKEISVAFYYAIVYQKDNIINAMFDKISFYGDMYIENLFDEILSNKFINDRKCKPNTYDEKKIYKLCL